MKLLPITVISLVAFLPPTSASADIGARTYIATNAEKLALELAVKINLKSAEKVSCSDVIVVRTAGINTATAGICILDGQELQLNCKNDMLGNLGASVRLHPDQTTESELRSLIVAQCTGG